MDVPSISLAHSQRIATDIAHLNTRCKELQATVDHSSLKASHDNEGLRKETANKIEVLRGKTMVSRQIPTMFQYGY